MSTFSGISTALSSLMAQRQALEVSGQNIANANTPGYTRQRAGLTSIQALSNPSMFANPQVAGNGVRVTSIDRLGDVFLDARVRSESSTAGYLAARSTIFARLESGMGEPSDTGIARQLQNFWSGWLDVSNRPDDLAARQVLLENANSAIDRIAAGYQTVSTQWEQARTQVDAMASDVNSAAVAIADLNDRISTITASGGSANELIDRREQLITELSSLVGATARPRDDGTVDVMVGGNALVRGERAYGIAVTGSHTLDGVDVDPVTITWSHGGSFGVDGGRLAGYLSALAPADGAGNGGILAEAAAAYNELATTLATTVNAVHQTGTTLDTPPVTGTDFFTFTPAVPAALGLTAITDPRAVAAGNAANGPLDGSVADAIAGIASSATGPDKFWASFVVDLGVTVASSDHRAAVAEAARASAENMQLASSSVDLDEESVNMLAYQRAYEGAARVLTAIDEMLDVLINRTGVVGR